MKKAKKEIENKSYLFEKVKEKLGELGEQVREEEKNKEKFTLKKNYEDKLNTKLIHMEFFKWYTLKALIDNRDKYLEDFNKNIQDSAIEINNLGERKIFINNEIEKIRQTRQQGPVQIQMDKLRSLENNVAEKTDLIKDKNDELNEFENEIKEKKQNWNEMQRNFADYVNKPNRIMNAIQSKEDDIKRKTLIIKELQNGLAGGNEAGLNILKNNMKLEIENLERDSKN